MGRKMQYKRNYSTRDPNTDAIGSSCLPYNEDRTLKIELNSDGVLPLSAPHRQPGYDKEDLRQIILKQEVIFMDQVQELHRLYRRQMAIMGEIERSQLHKQSEYVPKMKNEQSALDSFSKRPNNLIDLNEPCQVDEEGNNTVDSLDPGIIQGEIIGRDQSALINSGLGVSLGESFGERKRDLDACSRPQENPLCIGEAAKNRNNVVGFPTPPVSIRGRPRHHSERRPIVVLALPAFNCPPPFRKFSKPSSGRFRHTGDTHHGNRSTRRGRRGRKKIPSRGSHLESKTSNTDHDPSLGHHGHQEHLKELDLEDVKSAGNMVLHSTLPYCSADVASQQHGCATNEGKSLAVPGASVVAPISPENQECPRPRGESEETPLELSEEKYRGPCEKPDGITAETSEASLSDNLHCLATVCCDPKYKLDLALSGKNDREQEVDFEAMTLKLVELRSEAVARKNNDQGDQVTRSTSFLRRERKGCRGRKREFNREILPGLASLANHEVTEDVLTVGGTTNKAENKPKVGKKRQKASSASAMESAGEMGSHDRSIPPWGNVKRRSQRQN